MKLIPVSALLFSLALAGTVSLPALADCESDMAQLEQAMKSPTLKPEAKAALDNAAKTSVAALKKDDDAACHKAIAEAMAKAGIPLK
jgi:hypothetical protein